jgi:dimethylargininase
MLIAVTRQVSRSIANCELAFLAREPIDLGRARRQHRQYEDALKKLGLAVLSLPEEPELPDSVFVEDTALVLDECAVITRPGAVSRLPEIESIGRVLAPYRELLHIQAPARLDGGDILHFGKRIYVGLTRRSDTNAMEQLQEFLAPHGYDVKPVAVTGCLHLKSAATLVAPDTLLINPAWVDKDTLTDAKLIEIDPSEPYAANALRLPGTALYASGFPRTLDRLVSSGIQTMVVEADELAKAEGALTCCSLVFEV